MKKLIAVLTVLCLLAACTAALAETPAETAVTFRNGVTFGMNQNEVRTAENWAACEYDLENSQAVVFEKLEQEHVQENGVPADLTYFFVNDRMVAFRLNFETRHISYDAVIAELTSLYGEPQPLDPAMLGNGVYAVDDEGRPEFRSVAFQANDMVIVVELVEDDIDVTYIDLTADYIR